MAGPAHQYTVVHCVAHLPSRATAYFGRETLGSYCGDESEKVCKPIRVFFQRHGMEATFAGKVGQAAEAIASLATKGKVDLMVLGSHGHGVLGNLVMGSVATRVVTSCRTPVLIVR